MRKILFGTILSLSVLLISCDLDKYPEDSIATNTAWTSITDAMKFRDGIYGLFQSINGGIYTYTSDYQSDLFNATISYSNRGGDMYRWDFTSSQYDIEDIYEFNYECINNCNNIIQNISTIAIKSDEEQAQADMIKGEAHLMRAICYHTLVLRFAKDYEPATVATDLGLPLVLEVDPNAKPERATLAKTYELIKSDISEARTFLKTEGEANSVYFTVDVIDAFEARVDLYMHNYSEAINLAKRIIDKYPLISASDELAKMWLNDEGSEVVYKVFMSKDERGDLTSSAPCAFPYYLNYSTGLNKLSPDFIPTKWVVELYENSDIRKETSFRQDEITCLSTTAPDIFLLNKYPGNPALKKSEYEYYQMSKLFRSAEAYLIAAEASYSDGDPSTALGYLNDLRIARSASSLNISGEDVLKAIKEEWIREFVGEGNRLNDLKRWHDGFSRHGVQNSSIVLSGVNLDQKAVAANDIRFVWEIPANDLKANTNLIPNWK